MLARCATGRRREAGLGRSAVGRGSSHVDTQGCLDDDDEWKVKDGDRGGIGTPPTAAARRRRRRARVPSWFAGCRAADERGTRLRLRFFGPKNIGTITDQCRRVCRKSRIFFAQARTSHRLLAPSPALPALLLSGPWSKRYQLECVEVKLGLEARVRGRGIWCENGRYWPTMRCWGVRLRRG
jgi:hypothetical protein